MIHPGDLQKPQVTPGDPLEAGARACTSVRILIEFKDQPAHLFLLSVFSLFPSLQSGGSGTRHHAAINAKKK